MWCEGRNDGSPARRGAMEGDGVVSEVSGPSVGAVVGMEEGV